MESPTSLATALDSPVKSDSSTLSPTASVTSPSATT